LSPLSLLPLLGPTPDTLPPGVLSSSFVVALRLSGQRLQCRSGYILPEGLFFGRRESRVSERVCNANTRHDTVSTEHPCRRKEGGYEHCRDTCPLDLLFEHCTAARSCPSGGRDDGAGHSCGHELSGDLLADLFRVVDRRGYACGHEEMGEQPFEYPVAFHPAKGVKRD